MKNLLEISSFYMCTKNHNHVMYGSWDTEWDRQNFLSFWAIFCPFTLYGPRKSKFWKNKKKSEDNIILQMCTINDSHMIYGSWDMECNGHNFFVTSDHFLPFYPLTTQKNHNFVKMKKTSEDVIILHMCTTNDNHMMYGSWDMKLDGQNFLSFWTIFYLSFNPKQPKKSKFWKNENNNRI